MQETRQQAGGLNSLLLRTWLSREWPGETGTPGACGETAATWHPSCQHLSQTAHSSGSAEQQMTIKHSDPRSLSRDKNPWGTDKPNNRIFFLTSSFVLLTETPPSNCVLVVERDSAEESRRRKRREKVLLSYFLSVLQKIAEGPARGLGRQRACHTSLSAWVRFLKST